MTVVDARLASVVLLSFALTTVSCECLGDDTSVAYLPGVVSRVIDGDTIEVVLSSGPIRVRLDSIDAPETSQPYGRQSSEALRAMVHNETVYLEPREQDRYSRIVAVVWLDDLNVNHELVRLGLAWTYRKYAEEESYCEDEEYARRARLGLWRGEETPIAPWEWRSRQKGQISELTPAAKWSERECRRALRRSEIEFRDDERVVHFFGSQRRIDGRPQ